MMVLTAACSNPAPAPVPQARAAVPTQANLGERTIDPGQEIAPPKTPAPATTYAVAKHEFPKVKTPSDDQLPSWVPKSGRLTVVSAFDHAKNLGLDDQTTSAPTIDPNGPGSIRLSASTWLPRNGRVAAGRSARTSRRY